MTANKRPAPLTLTDKRNSRARIGSPISAARSDSQSHALSPLSPSPFQVPTISNINAMRSASMVHVRRVDYVASIFSFLPCSKKTDSRRRRRFWSRPVWLHLSSIVFFFFFAYRHLRRWSRVGGWKTFASRPAPSSCLHNSDHGGGPNRDMPCLKSPPGSGMNGSSASESQDSWNCELYALMLAVAWAAALAAATETSLSLFMQALSNRFPAY